MIRSEVVDSLSSGKLGKDFGGFRLTGLKTTKMPKTLEDSLKTLRRTQHLGALRSTLEHTGELRSTPEHNDASWITLKHPEVLLSPLDHSKALERTLKHSEDLWSALKFERFKNRLTRFEPN